jgi:hypothetical protein
VLSTDVAPAAATDAAMIQELLRHAGLPLDGLTTQFPRAYVVVRDGPQLIAVAGLETELAACAEFAGACPASAACLARAP